MYTSDILVDVQQKTTKFCKAIVLPFKNIQIFLKEAREILNIQINFAPKRLGKVETKPPKLAEGNKPQKSEQKNRKGR